MLDLAKRIPPAARPLAFLVVPAVIVHALFMKTPDVASSQAVPATPPAVRKAALQTGVLSNEAAKQIIEQSPEFDEGKRVECPRYIKEAEFKRNALAQALVKTGMAEADYSWTSTFDIKVDMTGAAHRELGTDLTEDPGNISIVVARRRITNVYGVQMDPAEPGATLVTFGWTWFPTNKVGKSMTISGGSRGSARAWLRKNGDAWQVAKLDLNDYSVR